MRVEKITHHAISQIYSSKRTSDKAYLDKMSNTHTQKIQTETAQDVRRMESARFYNENLGQNVDMKA